MCGSLEIITIWGTPGRSDCCAERHCYSFLGDRRYDPFAPYAEALRKKLDQDMRALREES